MPVIDTYARLLAQRTRKPAAIAQILDEFFLHRLNEIEHEVDELSPAAEYTPAPDSPLVGDFAPVAKDVAEVKARSGKKNLRIPKESKKVQ